MLSRQSNWTIKNVQTKTAQIKLYRLFIPFFSDRVFRSSEHFRDPGCVLRFWTLACSALTSCVWPPVFLRLKTLDFSSCEFLCWWVSVHLSSAVFPTRPHDRCRSRTLRSLSFQKETYAVLQGRLLICIETVTGTGAVPSLVRGSVMINCCL